MSLSSSELYSRFEKYLGDLQKLLEDAEQFPILASEQRLSELLTAVQSRQTIVDSIAQQASMLRAVSIAEIEWNADFGRESIREIQAQCDSLAAQVLQSEELVTEAVLNCRGDVEKSLESLRRSGNASASYEQAAKFQGTTNASDSSGGSLDLHCG